MLSNSKIAAIYDLRSAVEAKVKAEQRLAQGPSPDARMALLDATLDVEEKTQAAIEVCHECGHSHHPQDGHGSNVIEVDFTVDSPEKSG